MSGWIWRALVAAAMLGVIVLTQLPLRFVQALAAWAGLARLQVPWANLVELAPQYHALIGPVETIVTTWPWLWPLCGALSLLFATTRKPLPPPQVRWYVLALLAALLVVALGFGLRTRIAPLLDRDVALAQAFDYDEAVYVSFAREWLGGNLPYRDTWTSHPPTGIALLTPTTALSSSGEDALINARRLNAVLDVAAALLLIWVGAQLGGASVGLVVGSVYLLDTLAGVNSTRVWLETGINLWSIAACGCALRGMHRDQNGWFVLAGIFGVLAATTKYTGVAIVVALVLTLLLSRRWRWLGVFVAGSAAAAMCYALLLLPLGWREIVQQTLIAQALRPADDISTFIRLDASLHTAASLLTTLCAGIGACAVLLLRPSPRPAWMLVLLWLATALALLAISPSFYDHYATQLVPPLALLAGGIALGVGRWNTSNARRSVAFPVTMVLVVLVPFALIQQPELVVASPGSALVASGRAIKARVPPNQPVMSFEPLFNLFGDRAFARGPDRRLLIDSYMQLRYINTDWSQIGWLDMLRLLREKGPLPSQPWDNASALMLEQSPWAVFEQGRMPRTKAEYVALAGNYRAHTLATGTLYERVSAARRFTTGGVSLHGVLVPTQVQAGSPLPIAMFWQKQAPEQRTPILSLQLVGAANRKVGQYDKPVGPAEVGLQAWPVGDRIYQDDIIMPVAGDAAPGLYSLSIIVYDPATGQRWPLVDEQGQSLDAIFPLDTITVTSP
ncbi:MAG: glycosyltransferase family 39 protein [Roseiflexaceae bacterium]|nr:glycosyltransferase family 39 protein [Roseiflexaceae bacterium]